MANEEAKVVYPALAEFYSAILPIAETFMRIVRFTEINLFGVYVAPISVMHLVKTNGAFRVA